MADATPIVSKDQGYGIVERVIYGVSVALFMKLVAKGWITAEEAPYYAGGVVTFLGGAYAWWINRPVSLITAVTNTGATVITTKEISEATPDNPNIVSTVAQAREVLNK